MIAWGMWRDYEQREEMLTLGICRLLLALGLAGVLWLPLPRAPGAGREHAWAIAAMSALTLVVLLRQSWPDSAAWRALRACTEPHWSLLTAVLTAAAIALTGGVDSPMAPLVMLLGPMWRHNGAVGRTRRVALEAAASAFGCFAFGALLALRLAPSSAALAGIVERGIVLGMLAGVLCSWQASLLAGGAFRRRAASSRAEALALERARGELLAHVSHELLAPVAVIRTSASLLGELAEVDQLSRGERLAPAGRVEAIERMVGAISRNAARLELCVQDLLELARLEEGKPTVTAAWHACADVLERAAELLAPLLQSKSQVVRVRVEEPGLQVWGDGRRIERVVTNLLANAHKYAGDGATIVLRAARDADGARFEVIDSGPGIPLDSLARLFDRYYRAPGVPGQGSGLGLAIVQAEVELHGGRVWAESTPGHGCRFVCVFPYPSVTEGLPIRIAEVSQ